MLEELRKFHDYRQRVEQLSQNHYSDCHQVHELNSSLIEQFLQTIQRVKNENQKLQDFEDQRRVDLEQLAARQRQFIKSFASSLAHDFNHNGLWSNCYDYICIRV